MVGQQLNSHMFFFFKKKNNPQPRPYTTYKIQLKMDHKPEHKTKRKYRKENLCEPGLGKLFLSPNDKRTIYTRKKKNR